MPERQKAKYRIVVFGLLAVLGPPAFGFKVGALVALYSILLVAYSLWSLRLTVVFPNDSSLGYLLCLFDAALVMPLLVWGGVFLVGGAVVAPVVRRVGGPRSAPPERRAETTTGRRTRAGWSHWRPIPPVICRVPPRRGIAPALRTAG